MRFNQLHRGIFLLAIFALTCWGCDSGKSGTNNNTGSNDGTAAKPALFTSLPSTETGIDFINNIFEDEKNNFVFYDYMYNGAGVAVGDFNNDGLQDVYFAGNMVSCKLYLNKGDFKFEDITASAGVDGAKGWCTSASLADVNADGFLDIYLCRSYNPEDEEIRGNLLYINNGDNTFTEKAKEYGVRDRGYSTASTFFDYDLDGDLDLYVGNHPQELLENLVERLERQANPDIIHSDRLYRNDGGKFTDVTKQAGIQNYAFPLGIVSSDLNNDGWPDIYVANDYEEADKMYINNGNGTFSDKIRENTGHISNFGMGCDLADYNNDGLLDIVVVDMLAEDNMRQKTQMPSMNPLKFWTLVDYDQHYQYMRNTLQINNGNGTFSEVGYLAGITNTDWSWAALLADFDNDGWKDLFVSNGYRRDTRNKDFQKMLHNQAGRVDNRGIVSLLEQTPQTKLKNYLFRNNGDLSFSNISGEAGLNTPSFSQGAAYADFDNDGDLDLVVNNLTDPAFVMKNNAVENRTGNYLRLKFEGPSANNPDGLGVKATVKNGDETQYQEVTRTRGYKSSVEPVLHFGLGDKGKAEQILIKWPDGKWQVLENQDANRLITVKYTDARAAEPDAGAPAPLFEEVSKDLKVTDAHKENDYDDYIRELLLPHKMSQFGPGLAVGDVNGDGREDFYRGGAAGQAGMLYVQTATGAFNKISGPWERDKNQEDLGAVLFDADGDKDLDLYVVSGGNEFKQDAAELQDRLYVNDGGTFTKATDALPKITGSGSCVVPGDFDADGDLDLFVGGRVLPGQYPYPARAYLLQNDGGKFTDVTATLAPDLVAPGLVTSAVWSDYDADGKTDLMVVGEWMPLTVFRNTGSGFENQTAAAGFANQTGWWNKIVAADFDGDGDEDYVAGNLGLNYKYQATETEPFEIYCSDFDENGTYDIVLGYFNQGNLFPVRGRQCSSEQMPFIKNKFPTYDDFGAATLTDVYGDALTKSLNYKARNFASVYIENQGGGKFAVKKLPNEAQFAPLNGLVVTDLNADGKPDIVGAGNLFVSEVETGRADAGRGICLINEGGGNFRPLSTAKSGFFARKDAKDVQLLKAGDGRHLILVANNDDRMEIFRFNPNANVNQLYSAR